ncbi:type II toxin-antitoxin system RelE/ParE family toxin [Bradyrhizobium sp. 190]|uniref:type II toxin-antitoxin system RelE/ParE family toxin n=1 Tax=Bradyrhizobium sp. 190 TaxID=2782658 RepID=UPI001FFBC7BF|nr:type II toxin-antitoxin system RelE/ParE family toxin [Bradyrhizobium sp. 190]
MKLVFDDQAIADLENIYGWIAQDSPSTARTVTDRLFSSIELLISFPLIGHVGRDPDTFEWVVPRLPYVVVYEVDREQERIVVRLFFTGRRTARAETDRICRTHPSGRQQNARSPRSFLLSKKCLERVYCRQRRSGRCRLQPEISI